LLLWNIQVIYSILLHSSIGLAATPGTSNHEGGRAVDTSYYSYWLSTLNAYGWAHSYPDSDPVHFDYSAASDIAKQNLMAFQKLWNANNPNSQISEDGIYGTQTANALYNSPCDGW
jgi:N-acetylmuramoyl-L-alanine amidase